ncbi:hypothetical protein, partial [Saccharopolyspora thermophila]|uniref:hypothetical protein n=1 Tax=Saccharopolyspora thermophila TaxID=89367 RepID=UPI001E460508
MHKWAGNIRRQLRVVRTLPGDTTEQALLRSRNRKRGEIDAPFEVPLVVAVHSVGDRVVLPVDRGDGVENVQVTRDTAAKCIGGLVQGYDSVFLLVPESEQADFAVNLAQKIVEQRDNLVVYTSAGTTHVTPDGKLVVMGNAGLVTVKRQLFLDFLSATRVEPLRTTRFTNAEQDAIDEQQAAADQSSDDESVVESVFDVAPASDVESISDVADISDDEPIFDDEWNSDDESIFDDGWHSDGGLTVPEGGLSRSPLVGIGSSGHEVEFAPENVVFRRKQGDSARPTCVSLSAFNEIPWLVRQWANNIGSQLRVVRTLPGETVEEALTRSQYRSRGEIDAPFEVPLVVAVHPVGDMVVLPVDRGNGVENVRVTKETAAEYINRTFPGYDSVFLLVPEGGRPDFAVNLAQKIVEQRDNLVVYTSAGTTDLTTDGKLVVLDNAGLVAVKTQLDRRDTLYPDFAVTTRVEPLWSTQFRNTPVYVLPRSAVGVGENESLGPVGSPDVLQRIADVAEIVEPDDLKVGKAEVERHPAESRVTYLTDGQRRIRLTPRVVRAWLAENGITYPRGGGIAQAVRIYTADPVDPENTPEPREYRIDEAQRFYDTVRQLAAEHHLAEQRGLANAINNLTDQVVEAFPPDQYTYVDFGRSTALIAALQARGHNAITVPVSNFPMDKGLYETFVEQNLHTPSSRHETVLQEHFDEFLKDLPADRDVLLLDFAASPFSVITAQYLVQRHLNDPHSVVEGAPAPTVYALAMCPLDNVHEIEEVRNSILDDSTSDQRLRDLWERLHLLPLDPNVTGLEYVELLAETSMGADQRPQDGSRMPQQERSATGYGGAFQAALGEPSSPAGSVPAGIVTAERTGGLEGTGTTWDPTAAIADWDPTQGIQDWDPTQGIQDWDPSPSDIPSVHDTGQIETQASTGPSQPDVDPLIQARIEQWQPDGLIDGAALRAKIKQLVAPDDEVLQQVIDKQFSDEKLAEKWSLGLEGMHIENLGLHAGRGPEVMLTVVGLSKPTNPHEVAADTTLGGAGTSVHSGASSSRAVVGTGPFHFRVPTPFVVVAGTISGLSANSRGSNLSASTEHRTSTKVTEHNAPVTVADHKATYSIVVREGHGRPWRGNTRSQAEISVDVSLKSVPTEPDGGRPGHPDAIEHAKISGIGDIYRSVQSAIGREFAENDPEARRFRDVLESLDDRAREVYRGRLYLGSFHFKGVGSPIDITLAVADVGRHQLPSVTATVERTSYVSGKTVSGKSVTSKAGGLGFIGGGDITGLVGGAVGPHMGRVRTHATSSATTEVFGRAIRTRYSGPLDKHRVSHTFVVEMQRRDGKPLTSPDQNGDGEQPTTSTIRAVPGSATLWMKPSSAAQHGWADNVASAPVPTTAPAKAKEELEQIPHRADARYAMPDATVDMLVGAALTKIQAKGQIGSDDLQRVSKEFRTFVRDHGRDIAEGGGARFPLSAWVRGAPDVFIKGTMHPSDAEATDGDDRETVETELAAGHAREVELTRGKSNEKGITTVAGILNLVWPSLMVSRLKKVTHGGKIQQSTGRRRLFTAKRSAENYRYRTTFDVRIGGTWSSPGEQIGVNDEGVSELVGDVVVSVPSQVGVPLGGSDDHRSEPTEAHPVWHDGTPPVPERKGQLPTEFELDAARPVPDLLPTTATMLGKTPVASWKEWLQTPFVGRQPVALDEHSSHPVHLAANEQNERNAALSALENFANVDARMARFDRAALGQHSVQLKTHNHGGMLGSRELFGTAALLTTLSNPTIVRRDDSHEFRTDAHRSTATVKEDKAPKGWSALFNVTLILGVAQALLMGVDVNTAFRSMRGRSGEVARKSKTTEKHTYRERGYLVRYEATHVVRTSVRRRWQTAFHSLHDGSSTNRAKWVTVPRAVEVWVPASQIHQVGELTNAELAKLTPQDADRYRANHVVAANTAETRSGADHDAGDAATDTRASASAQRPSVPTGPNGNEVRPPANVGQGRGEVSLNRLEAGRELAAKIAGAIEQWTQQQHTARVDEPLRVKLFAPPGLSHFEALNDSLRHDELDPDFGSADAHLAVERILNGGLPVFGSADTPFGKVEQLIVVRGLLGDGRYDNTIEPTGEQEHKAILRKVAAADSETMFRAGVATILYPFTKDHATLLSFGVQGEVTRHKAEEFDQKRTDAVTMPVNGTHHQFVHDLIIQLDIYPYASAGTYRKFIANALSQPTSFGEPWRADPIVLEGAVRSTVRAEETVEAGTPEHAPIAVKQHGLWQWQFANGRPLGFSDNAIVHIRPFEAPKLRATVQELINGDAHSGRPALRPKTAYELLTAITVDNMRTNLPAMASRGYEIEPTTGELQKLRITVNMTRPSLLEVAEQPLERNRGAKDDVRLTAVKRFGVLPNAVAQFREQGIEGVAMRPFQQYLEAENELFGFTLLRNEFGASAENSKHSVATTRYRVSVVPHWRIRPYYRGEDIPAAAKKTISTGPDEPIEMWVDRQGLADLGFTDDDLRGYEPPERFAPHTEPPAVPSSSHGTAEDPSLATSETSDHAQPEQQEFRARYPQLWGVNGEKYAQRVPGHTANCGQALIAAEQTVVNVRSGNPAGGVTVPAVGGEPMTVGALAQHFGARPVWASREMVEAHMKRQDAGAMGAVFLRSKGGMLHAVMAEKGPDSAENAGEVRFLDPQ